MVLLFCFYSSASLNVEQFFLCCLQLTIQPSGFSVFITYFVSVLFCLDAQVKEEHNLMTMSFSKVISLTPTAGLGLKKIFFLNDLMI